MSKDKNPSYLARMQGTLVKGIQDRSCLLKAIIIVMEDDLITNVGEQLDSAYNEIFQDSVTWLADEFDKLVSKYWQLLPSKARREDYTKILWIAAPLHDGFLNNALQKKFNSAIYHASAEHRIMNTIKLKANWDAKNFCLVTKGSLTGEGLYRYWEAIDQGFLFWQNVMLNSPRIPQKLGPKSRRSLDFSTSTPLPDKLTTGSERDKSFISSQFNHRRGRAAYHTFNRFKWCKSNFN